MNLRPLLAACAAAALLFSTTPDASAAARHPHTAKHHKVHPHHHKTKAPASKVKKKKKSTTRVAPVSTPPSTGTTPTVAAETLPATTPTTTTAPAYARTLTVPTSIDATGTTDVTAALRTFLKAAPDNSVVRFAANGRYRVEDVVLLVDKNRMVLEGNGATLFATTSGYRERSLLRVVGGSDITVRNFHLVGAHPSGGAGGTYVVGLEAQHGVEILGTQRALVERNDIHDVYGDFVYLQREMRKIPTFMTPARDVTVRDNTFASNGRQGVSFINVDRVLVTNNVIDDVRRSVFDLEPTTSAALVENVTITRNTVGLHQLNFLSAGGNGSVNDIMVSYNTLKGGPMNSTIKNQVGETRRNWSFIGNVSDRNYATNLGGVVYARGVEGIQFRDNVQPIGKTPMSQPLMAGLYLTGSCGGVSANNNLGPNPAVQMAGVNPTCATAVTLGGVATAAPLQ